MNCEIFFNFGIHQTNTAVGRPLQYLKRATVFGPKTACYQHQVGAVTDWFLVQLTPLGVRTLLGCPVAAIVNADVELADLLEDSGSLVDSIEAADGFRGRLEAFEQWAIARIAEASSGTIAPTFSNLYSRMRAAPLGDIGSFATELGIGERRFRSVISDEWGLAPKAIQGFFRAEHGWTSLYETRSIAEASGLFSDHAHFTRNFRRYTGITPNDYKRLKMSGDAILNGFDERAAARLAIQF